MPLLPIEINRDIPTDFQSSLAEATANSQFPKLKSTGRIIFTKVKEWTEPMFISLACKGGGRRK